MQAGASWSTTAEDPQQPNNAAEEPVQEREDAPSDAQPKDGHCKEEIESEEQEAQVVPPADYGRPSGTSGLYSTLVEQLLAWKLTG